MRLLPKLHGILIATTLLFASARAFALDQQQQCLAEAGTASRSGPRFYIPDEGEHLDNIREVIAALGYTPTDDPADAQLIWAWRDPFKKRQRDEKRRAVYNQLSQLKWNQLVNQVPGIGYIGTKSELAELSRTIKAIPTTFKLPEQYEEWQQFIKTDTGDSQLEWVTKSPRHRGISIIPDNADPELNSTRIVQQLVRPYLIDGRLWDLGVYVAITQLEPLMAYVFTSSALLRFCSKPYERNITEGTDTSSYVIYGLEDFTPGIEIPTLQPYYAEALLDTTMGSTMSLSAVSAYLSSQDINTTKWWLEMQSVIVQVLQAQVPKMEELRSYYYPDQRTNFFSLVRFDFILDERAGVNLIEVNMGPGLHKKGIDLQHQLLPRKIVHDLLSLKGMAPGGRFHISTADALRPMKYHVDASAILGTNCNEECTSATDCSTKLQCMLCRACQSDWQIELLTNIMAEHHHSHGFMRIHPPHRQLSSHMLETGVDFESYFDADVRPDDVLVKAWLQRKCEHDYRWC